MCSSVEWEHSASHAAITVSIGITSKTAVVYSLYAQVQIDFLSLETIHRLLILVSLEDTVLNVPPSPCLASNHPLSPLTLDMTSSLSLSLSLSLLLIHSELASETSCVRMNGWIDVS